MMGQHSRSEALFYYFRVEDQVPENHLLRLIDKHVSFSFVRAQLKDSYSETGRPSIDPELLLRILLIDSGSCSCQCAKPVSMSCAATVS
jgi:transposase